MSIFSESEIAVLGALLAGSAREFNLLSFQLNQIKEHGYGPIYQNEYFYEHFTYLLKRIRRSFPERSFLVPTFGEDCAIGAGRPVLLNDVIAELTDGSFLCFQLEIRGGKLSNFRILGNTVGPDQPLLPIKGWGTSWFQVKKVHYIEKNLGGIGKGFSRIVSERAPFNYAQLLPKDKSEPITPFQEWILSLDNVVIPISPEWIDFEFKLPLTIRRAPPASSEELRNLKEHHRIFLPTDLDELWTFCDGCMFLGTRMFGVFDLLHFRKEFGIHWEELGCEPGFQWLPLRIGEDQRILAVEVYSREQAMHRNSHIRMVPADPEYPVNEWFSLKSLLEMEIEVVKRRVSTRS